jgi:nicotinamidase-related amidase
MQRHDNILRADDTLLVVVDLQEAFRPAIFDFDKIVARTAIVIEAAKLLRLPIMVTEQVPAKLGATVSEIRRVLPGDVTPIAKSAFSAFAEGSTDPHVKLDVHQILLAGIESHVCMNQSAHDLLQMGYQVHVLQDCTSSRTPENRALGIDKMLRSGALPSSSELALFELMVGAKHEQFRAISKLVK